MTHVEEGKLRAAQARAILTDEERDKVDALVASVPDLMRRAFCGPANKKGRQEGYYATEEEYRQWRIDNLKEMS